MPEMYQCIRGLTESGQFLELGYVFLILWLASFANKSDVPFDFLVTQDLNQLKEELPMLLRLTPVMAMLGTLGMVAPKLSFLMTLLRLVVKPCQKSALWTLITLSTVTSIPLLFLPYFICGLGFFPSDGQSSVCISPRVVFGYTGMACAIQIFMVSLLPLLVLCVSSRVLIEGCLHI